MELQKTIGGILKEEGMSKPEGAEIVIRDDGVFFDISDENAQATSTRAFVVSCYMEQLGENKHHLKTMSFNRSAFWIGK